MIIDDIQLYSIITIIAIVGFFIGKFRDTFWRASMFRKLTKKEWGVLGITSPDLKNVRMITVNFSRDIIQVQGKVWVVLKNRIYRQDKPERGFRLDKEDIPIKWIEGVPTIYVNETTFMPLDFEGIGGNTKPEEISSVFLSWVNNQLAKGFASMKNYQTFMVITLILALCATLLAYMSWSEVGNVKAMIAELDAKITKNAAALNPAVIPTPTR